MKAKLNTLWDVLAAAGLRAGEMILCDLLGVMTGALWQSSIDWWGVDQVVESGELLLMGHSGRGQVHAYELEAGRLVWSVDVDRVSLDAPDTKPDERLLFVLDSTLRANGMVYWL